MSEVYQSPKIPKNPEPSEYSDVMRSSTPTKNGWASLMMRPPNAVVNILDKDEKILMIIRSHPITQLNWILIAIFLILVPLLVPFIPLPSFLLPRFEAATVVLWYMLVTSVIIDGFLGWYYNIFCITDERIIDFDFIHLVYKNITATKIDNIEDVTFSVSGFLPSVLNYGNVLIQTAGEVIVIKPDQTSPAIEMRNAPQPARVAKLINELMLQEEQEKIEGRTH